MADFQLDTSGRVRRGAITNGRFFFRPGFTRWEDLNPFTQGHGTAMARALYERLIAEGWQARSNAWPETAAELVAFRNWAPESLARIMADVERAIVRYTQPNHALTCEHLGREFWRDRQRYALCALNHDNSPAFPPLTPYLGDDGLIYLREGL